MLVALLLPDIIGRHVNISSFLYWSVCHTILL